MSPSDALDYASEDADITLAIYNRVLPRVFNDKKYSVYKRLENPLINVLIEMENTGITINAQTLSEISKNLSDEIMKLENKISKIAFIGMGLINSSLARDLKIKKFYFIIKNLKFESAVTARVYPIKNYNFFSLPRIYVGKNTCEEMLINHLSGFYNLTKKLF